MCYVSYITMYPQDNTPKSEPLITQDPVLGINQTPPPANDKRVIVGLIIFLLLIVISLLTWMVFIKNDTEKQMNLNEDQALVQPKSDKEGIQVAVDLYCQELGRAYGFNGMDSGYIISDRFSEEELSDSPDVLRFKQVGNAASATVDCEDEEGPSGISNDLLFIKESAEWRYVDEVQGNTSSGFLCSIVDQYDVSKELVKQCAPYEGAAEIDR